VKVADECHAGLVALRAGQADTAVVNILLPGCDGFAGLRALRREGVATPILLLSSCHDVAEKVAGLEAGADDYVAKPFAIEELVARVRALLRRCPRGTSKWLSVGDLTLDPTTRTAVRDGQRIALTHRECQVLECLMRSNGTTCSRADLLHRVWNCRSDPGTNIVDVYIRKLREKIDALPGGRLLHNIRGVGYRLTAPETLL